MKLNTQRRVAASLLKCGPKRVRFDPASLSDIKEAITKSDMRLLISDGIVSKVPFKGVSRGRARQRRGQRCKGLRHGEGSRKGTPSAAQRAKGRWILKIRGQRAFLQELRLRRLVSHDTYRDLYRKSKGGFFRSRRHIKLYLDDHRLWQQKGAAPEAEKAGKRQAKAPATKQKKELKESKAEARPADHRATDPGAQNAE